MDLNATIDPPFTSPTLAFQISGLLMELNTTIDPPFPSPTRAFRMSGHLVELNAMIDPPLTSPTQAFSMSVWHCRVLKTHLILGCSSGPAFIDRKGAP